MATDFCLVFRFGDRDCIDIPSVIDEILELRAGQYLVTELIVFGDYTNCRCDAGCDCSIREEFMSVSERIHVARARIRAAWRGVNRDAVSRRAIGQTAFSAIEAGEAR
ncbi:hypothetical protein WBP07_01750 [Novosphingobium sp. BL-8A]